MTGSGHKKAPMEAELHFRPLHDRVVLRRIVAEAKSAGGIIIPDTVREKPAEGEILAVGPGARNPQGMLVPTGVQVGDRVLFGKWSGTEIKLGGQELVIMKADDLLGIVETAPAKDSPTIKARAA